jgi:hypothetical protein
MMNKAVDRGRSGMFGGPNSEALNQNAVLGSDRTFSPAVVNELRVGFNRFKSCRREMLDHVIPLNERHLRRLLRAYVSYHNQDRIHDALYKDAPNPRPVVSARLLPKLRYRKCGLATQSGGLTSAGLTQDAKLPPLERLAARILIFNLF